MTHRIWIDPYTWTNDTVLEAHKRDESIAYIEGLYPPHYPMPTTLLRAYTELYECVDMRCNYWEPSKY